MAFKITSSHPIRPDEAALTIIRTELQMKEELRRLHGEGFEVPGITTPSGQNLASQAQALSPMFDIRSGPGSSYVW